MLIFVAFLILWGCSGVLSQNYKKERRIEPYMANPKGLNEERMKLLYPFTAEDYVEDIGFLRPSHEVKLTFRLPFYGFKYNTIRIHKDGYLTFNTGKVNMSLPMKFPELTAKEDPAIIAPFLSGQNPVPDEGDSGLYLRVVDLKTEPGVLLRERILRDFREGMITATEFSVKCVVIATWNDMAMAGDTTEEPELLNTFQAVIATNEVSTYAMFNYAAIKWITNKDLKEGTNGPPAFVGFNGGNRTRSYEYKPYSQHPYLKNIDKEGFGTGIKGRYFFQIDEDIFHGSCFSEGADFMVSRPLTVFPRSGSMLGGSFVNLTGPCFYEKHRNVMIAKKKVSCFTYTYVETSAEHKSYCMSCRIPHINYHGFVDITYSDGKLTYTGQLYIIPPDITDESLFIDADNDREKSPQEVNVFWNPNIHYWEISSRHTKMTLDLFGFRELDGLPELTQITNLLPNTSFHFYDHQYSVKPKQFENRHDADKLDMLFGFIRMRYLYGDMLPYLWSRPMPLSWFFKPQLDRKYGVDKWQEKYCQTWVKREKINSPIFMNFDVTCPCESAQAEAMRNIFIPDPNCNAHDRNCDFFHRKSHRCFISGRAGNTGAGQICCYKEDGAIIPTESSIYGGRQMRSILYGKYPYIEPAMVPALAYWTNDVMPLLYCCMWQDKMDNSQTCKDYKELRSTQKCTKYAPIGVGSVYGDPHFITFDGTKYTFNGKGEFVLARVDNKHLKTEVQARFEQAPRRNPNGDPGKGTAMTAIVIKDNVSAIVEFRIRPAAALWRYQLFVMVDKKQIYFWDDSMKMQLFKGVTLYQYQGTWNMSHIVALFDSGLGVEVKSSNGYMSATIYVTDTYYFQKEVRGLLGTWSNNKGDDFTTPTGEVIPKDSDSKKIYESFANLWRVTETDKKDVGVSLFDHDPVPFSYYQDEKFVPDFGYPPSVPKDFPFKQGDIDSVCGSSVACKYDFIVTENKEQAEFTKLQETQAYDLMKFIWKDEPK